MHLRHGVTVYADGLVMTPGPKRLRDLRWNAYAWLIYSLPFVIKPRLEAVNAPCERIIAIDEHFTFDKDGILRLGFELAEHKPRLVIIDPLFSYTGKIKDKKSFILPNSSSHGGVG